MNMGLGILFPYWQTADFCQTFFLFLFSCVTWMYVS